MLDIGTGWGPLAYEVLLELPEATLVGHDFSEPMLEKATATLAEFGERASFWRGDLTDPTWADGIGDPFDAVVSAHAIHNVRSHSTIAAVYSTACQLLSPGGWFVNLEIVDPAGPATGAAYGRLRTGAIGVRAPHEHGHEHGQDLAAATLVDHLRWLTDAGFAEVDCLWKDARQALLVGVAPRLTHEDHVPSVAIASQRSITTDSSASGAGLGERDRRRREVRHHLDQVAIGGVEVLALLLGRHHHVAHRRALRDEREVATGLHAVDRGEADLAVLDLRRVALDARLDPTR